MKRLLTFLIVFLSFFVVTNVYAAETGRVVGDFVTVRKTASSSSSKLASVIYGTTVSILAEEKDYYKIVYDGLNTGYMAKKYILKETEYTLNDPEYCEELKKAGFDSTYCPYLSYIHKNHPNWTFTALKTGINFYDAVDHEEGKNYINSTIDAYRASDKQMEKGWYVAKQSVVAYMLDPRNFLLDKTIFMFENLGYNEEAQTSTVVKSLFGKSYLSEDKYVNYYLNAGSKYNISPVHLAARSIQEGASKSTYGAITGTYTGKYDGKSLKGFYNYYNIGAYADSKTSNPMLRGLAYAAGYVGGSGTSYGRPWNSREKAITGGANFLASTYIGKGQNTLYLEKFNVNPNSSNSLYTHQYMTNVMAPYEEGINVRSSYSSMKVLDSPYNFVIPVFEKMPPYTEQQNLLSGDNILAGIYIDGTLIEGFDADLTEYKLYVLDTVEEISLSAVSNSADVQLEGVGVIKLEEGENTLIIKVTAENGDVKEYKLIINKVSDTSTVEDVVKKLSVKVKGDYFYGISPGTAIKTLSSSVNKISPTASITVLDTAGNIVTDGSLATGYKVMLKTLTSNGTYTVAVTGDLNGDGKTTIQDLLRLQKHILGSIKLTGIYELAADANYNSQINIQDLLRVQKYLLGSVEL